MISMAGNVPVTQNLEDIYPADAIESQGARWSKLLSGFKERYGRSAEFVSRSPGRVNIIGEHIDYSLYEVIPMAVTADVERAIRESYPKPKMMILGFPSNPTAQCVELDFFERVIALAKQYNVLVIHDLAYADIVYDGWKAPSIMQVPGARDVAVEFFTLSKS